MSFDKQDLKMLLILSVTLAINVLIYIKQKRVDLI